jgi:hypothetical protein
MPAPAADADQVVLLVLDGLGWEQLQDRAHLAPTWPAMVGGPITSVVPSTTATALTSITTGLPPGEHGVIGYRMAVEGEVLNVLRWSTPDGDARDRIPPERLPGHEPFGGQRPHRHQGRVRHVGVHRRPPRQVRFHGYRMPSTMVAEVRPPAPAGEPFVYAYYDGIDKVAHEYGLGDHYDAELRCGRPPGRRPARAAARRVRRWWSPPTTARSTSATTSPSPHPRCSPPPWHAVRRGPVPLAPRPPGPHRRCSRRRRPTTAPGLGAHPRPDAIDEGWFGPKVSDRPRPAGRRGPRAPRAGRLPRPGRHRPVRAHRPARLAHLGRDARPALAAATGLSHPDTIRAPGAPVPDPPSDRSRGRPDRPRTGRARTRARSGRPTVRRGRGRAGVGRGAGQGHADRLDDQAAARRGAHADARRGQPRAPARDLRPVGHELGALSPDLRDELDRLRHPVRRRRRRRAMPSCGSPRPSSSAGSRACSTASRPRCSPSRWRPASSSSRCARTSSPRRRGPGPAADRPGTYL